MVSKICIPHLLKSANPHILTMSPPLYMNKRWLGMHMPYTLSKYGMTMVSQGLADEFKGQIGVNCLWPRVIVATAAIEFEMADANTFKFSRKPVIMADAAYNVIVSNFKNVSGNFFIDDELLEGVDLKKYSIDPTVSMFDMFPDSMIE